MPKAIVMDEQPGKPGKVYWPLKSITVPLPTPGPNEVVVRILCAALNHRDLFARQKLYRGAAGNIPILADGCGIVVSAGSSDNEKKWQGKRVLIAPARGWNADLRGPEREFAILGGTKQYPDGTCQEFICVPSSQVLACPPHLSDAEAAAIPLAALTAWRATMVKAVVSSGQRVLVTGIGGGVALFALQFAVAAGAEVWVTSGSAEKVARAVELGAKGGVSYKEKDWAQKLLKHTSKGGKSGLFDAVIDGAGGDVITAAVVLLRTGGIVASYGMTVGPKVVFPMPAVMKNIEMRGSTMGSLAELADAVRYISSKRIVPVVDSVHSLPNIEDAFDVMKVGRNFGKIVVRVQQESAKI
ncbi:hypothetical protein VE01_09430 [Pseudogymnoascus verrucosus]|uniref:Enoyl reductase (ER) domain-containing protein n=1 Tax=Pseudogymnoascus verrucosus TaxID=342668 RepID=A0A1B8G900_9PEZI|nr:uncharacterized protein VE01_09430 [Pseudogymnoascus verrucosus]OBT92320.1 hypothetical protein VE01_09430 [Pseudogymnoascus verrucosus]